MDSSGTIQEFFYNFVPGALLVVSLYFLLGQNSYEVSEEFDLIIISLLIVIGLFVGFLLQGVTRLLRGSFLFGPCLFLELKFEETSKYSTAIEELKKLKIITSNEASTNSYKQIKNNLYLMDNYIRAKKYNSASEHFAAKSAFWSNVLLGLGVILIVMHYKPSYSELAPIIIVSMIFSYIFARIYYKSQYDAVIKSFLTIVKIDR